MSAIDVFPLKLTTFERCMYIDDEPSAPIAYPIEMRFAGTLDMEAFRAALDKAIERHPLLGAQIEKRGRRFYWKTVEGSRPVFQALASDEPFEYPAGEFIDLASEGGLRIWARSDLHTTELRFQFHHSSADGVGAYRFIEDALIYYDQALRGAASTATIRPIDPQRLARRDRYMPRWLSIVRAPLDFLSFVVGAFRFFAFQPARVAQPEVPRLDDEQLRRMLDLPCVHYQGSKFARVRDAAKRAGVSVNDFLAAACFYTVRHWNERYRGRGWRVLRVMIPFDLRQPGDEALSAANVVSMANVDYVPALLPKPGWLMKAIHYEVQLIKRMRWSLTFLRVADTINVVPGLESFLAKREACAATIVFSTMWRLFGASTLTWDNGQLLAGNLRLEEISSAPPINRTAKIAVSCLSYGDCLSLIINYDRRYLTKGRAAEFLDKLRARLDALVAQFAPDADRLALDAEAPKPDEKPAESSPSATTPAGTDHGLIESAH